MNKFFLITGPNGVGKSRFLEQYYEKVKDSKSDDEKILFMKSKENFNPVNRQLSIFEGSDVFYRPNKEIIEKIFEAAKSEVCDKNFSNKKLNHVEMLVKQNIVDIYKCDDFSSKKDEIIEMIIKMMKNTVKENVKPTDYLWSMCCGYSKLFDQYKSEARNSDNLYKVEKFYNDQTQNQASLAALSANNKELLHKIILDYAFNKCGVQKFAEEINETLEIISYKYKLTVKPESNSLDSSLSFTLSQNLNNNQNNDTIKLEKIQLSSGESWILGVLMWQYTSTESSNRIPIKFKEIILDEPDRHLDPILCRQFLDVVNRQFISKGIQVIMTTHRVDTVTLAPKDRIFKLPAGYNYNTKYKSGEDQLKDLQNSCKLEAIFRMTSNLREITNYHHKVFTEALYDADFYESVYSFLRVYCTKIRQDARKNGLKGNDRFNWSIKGEELRILSERCQLSFYPVSTADNDKGGCEEVKKAVRRGQNFHDATKGPFDELASLKPYGILDNDFNKKHDLSGKLKDEIDITDYIVIIKRHSLENFLYDPFIIVSIANYKSSPQTRNIYNSIDKCFQDLKNALDKETVEPGEVQSAANECFKKLIGKKEEIDKEKIRKDSFNDICKQVNIEKHINPAQKDALPEKLELTKKYVKAILNKVFNFEMKNLSGNSEYKVFDRDAISKEINFKAFDVFCNIIKPEQIINRRIVEHFKIDNALNKLGTQKIAVIINKDRIVEVEYPNLFLQWRGKELISPSKSEAKAKFIKHLLNNLREMYQCVNLEEINYPLYIPMDLAKLFFDLSTKARLHVRETIKK